MYNPYMNQQQYQPNQIYQNPAHSATMGGYYNQLNTGRYYNPYLEQQRMKQLEAQQREEERKQADIWKKLARNSNEISPYVDDIEDHVKKYDPDIQKEYINEESKYNKLLSLKVMSFNETTYVSDNMVRTLNAKIVKVKEEYPDDMDLGEYFDKAGELLLNAKLEKTRSAQRDISKLYKGRDYKDLIKYHSSGGYYNSVFGNNMNNKNVNIDDMEITLPNNIGGEYQAKRQAFLESIMK